MELDARQIEKVDIDINEKTFESMEFESEDSAISFYMNYANRTGFRTRISRYCRSKTDNTIISRQIVCTKAGFHQSNNDTEINDSKPKSKKPKIVTKVGCKAMIEVKRADNGKWIVTKFEKDHNHALSSSSSNSKNKKPIIEAQEITNEPRPETRTLIQTRRFLFEELYKEAVKYAEEGSVNEDIYNIAIASLREASEKVSRAKMEMKQKSTETDSGSGNHSGTETTTSSLSRGDGLDGSIRPVDKMDGSASTSKNAEASILGIKYNIPLIVGSSGGGVTNAIPVSCRPGPCKMMTSPQPTPAKQKESGVHATAIACGARVIPAEQAASLVQFIEAKIRSGKAIIKRSKPEPVTGVSSSDETGEDCDES